MCRTTVRLCNKKVTPRTLVQVHIDLFIDFTVTYNPFRKTDCELTNQINQRFAKWDPRPPNRP